METRVRFSIDGRQYILFIEKRVARSKLNLFQCSECDPFLNPIPIKISTSTLGEIIGDWLIVLKRYWVKKRNNKCGQARSSNSENCFPMKYLIGKISKKYNEKILLKNGFVHCAQCRKIISKSDKYCQYCGKATGIKTF